MSELYTMMLGINARTRHEELAWELCKLLCIGDSRQILALQHEAAQRFPQLVFLRSDAAYLEVIPPESSKRAAVEALQNRCGVRQEETVAFGDSFVDMDMLRYAGLGHHRLAENESVEWVWSGRQYSTVAKPTDVLVGKTVEIIKSLQAGDGMPAADVSVNNGKIDVPVYELPPVVVTKDNAKEAFANDPGRLELLK